MTETVYTLKQIVAILAPAGDAEAAPRLARQLRHWTARDILVPMDGKRTGTGVSRRYGLDEVRKAAILVELSNFRVPSPVLEMSFADAAERWPGSKAWLDAIEGRKAVYLFISYNDDIVTYQIDPNRSWMLNLETEPRHTKRNPTLDQASAIVVNLTKVFARLRT
jgi:hypothetical protein